MNYNFVQFKHRQREMKGAYLLVAKHGISISKEAYKILDTPQIVEIAYDVEKKAIKISSSESKRAFKIYFTGRSKQYPIIRARSFYKTMPSGYYDFIEEEKIFLMDIN